MSPPTAPATPLSETTTQATEPVAQAALEPANPATAEATNVDENLCLDLDEAQMRVFTSIVEEATNGDKALFNNVMKLMTARPLTDAERAEEQAKSDAVMEGVAQAAKDLLRGVEHLGRMAQIQRLETERQNQQLYRG